MCINIMGKSLVAGLLWVTLSPRAMRVDINEHKGRNVMWYWHPIQIFSAGFDSRALTGYT